MTKMRTPRSLILTRTPSKLCVMTSLSHRRWVARKALSRQGASRSRRQGVQYNRKTHHIHTTELYCSNRYEERIKHEEDAVQAAYQKRKDSRKQRRSQIIKSFQPTQEESYDFFTKEDWLPNNETVSTVCSILIHQYEKFNRIFFYSTLTR